MKEQLSRKTPRFFVINPVSDRRNEHRFESEEPILIQNKRSNESFKSVAYEVGHFGMRMESARPVESGDRLQIDFISHSHNIGCFGQVVWVETSSSGLSFNCGVAIEYWFGIVVGNDSWKHVKGIKPKKDRRIKIR